MFYKILQEPEYSFFKRLEWSRYYSDEGNLDVQFNDVEKTIGINNKGLFAAAISNMVAEQGMDEVGNINSYGEQLEMAYTIYYNAPFLKR